MPQREITITITHPSQQLREVFEDGSDQALVDQLLLRGFAAEVGVDALASALDSGSDGVEVLAALLGMAEASPEFADVLARSHGVTGRKLARTLSWTGDADFLDYDPSDDDVLDLERLLDDAAAFGTIEDVLDDLCRDDPMAGETVERYYGLYGKEPMTFVAIGEQLDRSREMCRRYHNRGIKILKERTEARRATS